MPGRVLAYAESEHAIADRISRKRLPRSTIEATAMSAHELPIWMRDASVRPRVVILGAPDRDRVRSELKRLRPSIARHAEIIAEDLDFEHRFQDGEQDLVIVLGGDGSILQAARPAVHLAARQPARQSLPRLPAARPMPPTQTASRNSQSGKHGQTQGQRRAAPRPGSGDA